MEEDNRELKEALDKAQGIIILRYVTLGISLLFGAIAAFAANAIIPLISGLILAVIVLVYNSVGYLLLEEG